MAVCQTSRGSGTTEHGYARMVQCGVNQFSTCRSAWKPADANAVRDDHVYAKWTHRLGFGLNIFVAYGYRPVPVLILYRLTAQETRKKISQFHT